jgi:hypothetical protein
VRGLFLGHRRGRIFGDGGAFMRLDRGPFPRKGTVQRGGAIGRGHNPLSTRAIRPPTARRSGAALDALQGSELLQDEDLDLVEAVAQSLLEEAATQYDQDAETGEGDEVGYADDTGASGGHD